MWRCCKPSGSSERLIEIINLQVALRHRSTDQRLGAQTRHQAATAAAAAGRMGSRDAATACELPWWSQTTDGGRSNKSDAWTDASSDVVLLMETLSDASMKRLFKVVYSAVGVCAALLIALLGMKLSGAFDHQDRTRPVAILGWAVAAFGAVLLTVCLAAFIWRLCAVRRAGLRWAPRRWRWTVIFLLQLVCIFFCDWYTAVTNLGVLGENVNFLDFFQAGMGAGTAFNSFMALVVIHARSFNLMVDGNGSPLGPSQDYMWLDAPWHRFGRVIGVYWLVYQGVAVWFMATVEVSGEQLDMTEGQCRIPWEATLAISLITTIHSGYMLLFLYFMRTAFVRFSKRSYVQFGWENILLRLTFRIVGIFVLFMVLSMFILGFVRIESCMSYTMAHFGFPPVTLAVSLLVALNTFLMLPTIPKPSRPVRAFSSGLGWMETASQGLRKHGLLTDDDAPQPVFCFETAVKLMYWCDFVYEYNPKTGQATPPLDLQVGLSLYRFTHFEYMETVVMDSHAMVAWNEDGTILLCFRGTYSRANVLADIKLWRTAHPPKRGVFWQGTHPLVHKGFLESWTGERLNQRVLTRMSSIINSTEFDKQNLRILVTGHSLGGAIAILAANDIASEFGLSPQQLSCYTFGCPRVGNNAFAAEHNNIVPDTWHVINDLDPVPRMAKFWTLYKRSGRRVIVNGRGDMVVSPMFLEFKLASAFMGRRNLAHHRLSNYRKSFMHVAAAQFHKHKSLPGGHEALKLLCNKGDIIKVLWVSSRSLGDLENVASKLWGHELHRLESGRTSDSGAGLGKGEDRIVGLLQPLADSEVL